MNNLLQLKDACLAYGTHPLLDNANMTLSAGEKLCLVGRNGTGKSSLLKVIAGTQALDDGQRLCSQSAVIAVLPQDPPALAEVKVFDYIAQGLYEVGELLSQYNYLIHLVGDDASQHNLNQLEKVQKQLDSHNGWQFEQRIQQIMTKLGLDGEASLQSLSGGWRRKAALAKALVRDPDILLLDEPTNHLDIDMIKWLEKQVVQFTGAIVFVSHDRAFIRRVANRIVDLDRGQLVSYPGNYEAYLEKKAQDLEVEAQHNALFDKKLAQEETWIRQGIKARRTRNEGRVRALKALREEYAQRRNVQGNVTIRTAGAAKSGKVVFESKGLGKNYGGQPLVQGLDLTIMRGDKVALVGPNGIGKSTLIKLLLQQVEPSSGSVKMGANLEIAYFDQHREQLDLDKPVIDVVADGKREIDISGKSRHVISYLQDFLFSPQRIQSPVSSLSGGEKNRLLLAKILAKPSNLLILDEPTNDLDVETLELLEETLGNYPGTLLLVSHDREFVDNVVTSSLFFAGAGEIQHFVGGYQEIENWYQQRELQQKKAQVKTTAEKKNQPQASKNKKLSYKLSLELEQLPAKIEHLETQLTELQDQISDPGFYQQDAGLTKQVLASLTQTEQELELAYARWDELESMK